MRAGEFGVSSPPLQGRPFFCSPPVEARCGGCRLCIALDPVLTGSLLSTSILITESVIKRQTCFERSLGWDLGREGSNFRAQSCPAWAVGSQQQKAGAWGHVQGWNGQKGFVDAGWA